MTPDNKPIRVILSAVTQDELNRLYAAFLGDPARVTVVSLAPTADLLVQNVQQVPAEVVVVDGDLFGAQGERALVDCLNLKLGDAAAIVLLSPAQEVLRGTVQSLARVREVLTKPVNFAGLIARVNQVGISERAATGMTAPAQAYLRAAGPAPMHQTLSVVGMRIFAFGASKGGTGKTTLATNFAYRLNQIGIRTCLLGFDVPDDCGAMVGLRKSPNSTSFYQRPGRDGFAASLQNKDGLDVVLSPNDHVFAAGVQREQISALVEAARDHHPPYAAIVMDLPPTETVWAIEPLQRANTVVLVLHPSVPDQVKLIETVKLLTGTVDSRYRVRRDAIYAVLNAVTDDDNVTPQAMQEAVRDFLDGYAPPVVGLVPWNPQVRPLQNKGVLPVTRLDDFTKAIDALVAFFYKDALGARVTGQSLLGRRSLLPFKVKLT